jgi:hypothetical protein
MRTFPAAKSGVCVRCVTTLVGIKQERNKNIIFNPAHPSGMDSSVDVLCIKSSTQCWLFLCRSKPPGLNLLNWVEL